MRKQFLQVRYSEVTLWSQHSGFWGRRITKSVNLGYIASSKGCLGSIRRPHFKKDSFASYPQILCEFCLICLQETTSISKDHSPGGCTHTADFSSVLFSAVCSFGCSSRMTVLHVSPQNTMEVELQQFNSSQLFWTHSKSQKPACEMSSHIQLSPIQHWAWGQKGWYILFCFVNSLSTVRQQLAWGLCFGKTRSLWFSGPHSGEGMIEGGARLASCYSTWEVGPGVLHAPKATKLECRLSHLGWIL